MSDSGKSSNLQYSLDKRDVNRLAAIVEFSGDAILGMTLDGIITEWNHGASELYNYSADEAIGRSVSFLLPSSHRDELDQIMVFIKKGGHVEYFDTVRVRKDGSHVDIALTASPIKDCAGHLTGVSWIARDITSRKAMEMALRESEEKFRVLTETASMVILLHQGDNYVYANPATELATGYSKDELFQIKFWELVAPEYRDVVRVRGAARLRGEHPEQRYEVKIVTKRGEQRWWDLASSKLKYQGKQSILVTDLDKVLHTVCSRQIRDSLRSIEVRYCPSGLSLIMANDQLKDLFSILVENAIKHSSGPLVIDIKLSEAWHADKKFYRVDVIDNGPGIPVDEKAILLADIQDERARKRGIGMQIIKSLVKKYGGQIALEDRVTGDPPKGVKFTVVLPAYEK